MLDSPLTLVLLGISAASAIASLIARPRSRPPLANSTDEDLLVALGYLEATNTEMTTQPRAPHDRAGPELVSHPTFEMRDAIRPKSVRSSAQTNEQRRRITLLIIEELQRREREYR